MAAENWGRIVNVSSAAARHPLAGMAAYGASKAALDQLTRVLALEGAPYNIVTTGVYPGVVDTRMQEESRGFGPALSASSSTACSRLPRLRDAPPARASRRPHKLPLHRRQPPQRPHHPPRAARGVEGGAVTPRRQDGVVTGASSGIGEATARTSPARAATSSSPPGARIV